MFCKNCGTEIKSGASFCRNAELRCPRQGEEFMEDSPGEGSHRSR